MILHCAASCDDNFVEHFCVMAFSVFSCSPNTRMHLMGLDLSDSSLSVIAAFVEETQFDIVCYEAPIERLNQLKTNHHLPTAVWCRLLLPELLPNDLHRVVYLDCDLIILEDISELGTLNLSGMSAALVPDPATDTQKQERFASLGMPTNSEYYNTGVMVMDLEKFRAENLSEKIIDFALNNSEKLTFMDQCAINYVMREDIFLLDQSYNSNPKEILFQDCNPKIVHFMGRKPWQKGSPLCGIIYHRARARIKQFQPLENELQIGLFHVISRVLKFARKFIRYPSKPHKRIRTYFDIRNYRYIQQRHQQH